MNSRDITSIYTDKNAHVPGVYALYGTHRTSEYVAYVGMGSNVSKRIYSHLVRADSNVVTTGAVTVNPEVISSVNWWEDEEFTDNTARLAAELIADEVLKPNMRTRRGASAAAHSKANDPIFRRRMEALFKGRPSGQLRFPNVIDLGQRLADLEDRIAELEKANP
jgi:hypothetical protein